MNTIIYPLFLLFTGNATRGCLLGGLWEERTDYNNCQPLAEPPPPPQPPDFSHSIYLSGYTLSLCALTVALVIFLGFRSVLLNSILRGG